MRTFPPLTELFDRVVSDYSGKIALIGESASLTYEELNSQSDQLAVSLEELGVPSGSNVGVALPRSVEFVVAILALLKIGAVYVPLPLDYPSSRLQDMIRDSEIKWCLTDAETWRSLPDSGVSPVLMDQAVRRSIPARRDHKVERIGGANGLAAYVMYTSGSTGESKGVVIPQSAIVNLVRGQDYASFGSDIRTLLHSPTAFDASTFEIWAPLLHGGTCVISRGGYLDIGNFKEKLLQGRVNALWLTSSIFNQIMDEDPRMLAGIAHVLTGGEALSVKHVRKALELLPNTKITNGYGPTETTTFACTHEIGREETFENASVPIGKPLRGVLCRLVDEHLREVPAGQQGELLIGGEGLAIGYLNKPEHTARKFVDDPMPGGEGKKFYRSGDLCRQLESGSYEFLGRLDDQVKIRGMRIELGEIESLLRSHQAVDEAHCRPFLEDGVVTGITAHISTNRKKDQAMERELRDYLKGYLPPGSIPSRMILYPVLPLTPQGKVDRDLLDQKARELPTPRIPEPNFEGEGMVFIKKLWGFLLPSNEQPGDTDNFFDEGGDSLKVLKFVHALEKKFRKKIPLYEFFKDPTPLGISRLTQTSKGQKMPMTSPSPLQPTSPPIVLLYNVAGDLTSYPHLAKLLEEDHEIIGIESPMISDPPTRFNTMEDAARAVIQELERHNLKTTPAFIGYSWGGLLAFEVARQWLTLKQEAPFLAVVGSECPPKPKGKTERYLQLIKKFPQWVILELVSPKKRKYHLKRLLKKFGILEFLIKENGTVDNKYTNYRKNRSHHFRLASAYHPGKTQGLEVHYFRDFLNYEGFFDKDGKPGPLAIKQSRHPLYPRYGRDNRLEPDGGWETFSGIVPVIHPIMSDHFKILLPPDVHLLATELKKAMKGYFSKNK